jgi:Subtilase family
MPTRVDPYLIWAQYTNFSAQGTPNVIQVTVELQGAALGAPDVLHFFNAYGAFTSNHYSNIGTKFFTATLPIAHVSAFASDVRLSRLQLASARLPVSGTGLPIPQGAGNVKPVIGIIDHGIAFAHKQFRQANGATRFLRFWDQTDAPRNAPWSPVVDFSYGYELASADIDGALLPSNAQLPEVAAYSQLQYEPARRRRAHGSHVAGLAAGWPSPFHSAVPNGGYNAETDPVKNLPLIGVQMPFFPVKDTSGGSLAVSILDGIYYILNRSGPNAPVVINVSDGAYAGSHDGQSILENAMDEVLDRVNKSRNFALVLAAGNAFKPLLVHGDIEFGQGHAARHTHAEGTITPNKSAWLDWSVVPDNPFECYLELWFPEGQEGASVTLFSPGNAAPICTAVMGANSFSPVPSVAAGVINSSQVPNGKGQMVLLAIADTRTGKAPHGVWRVEITNRLTIPVIASAYAERSDLPYPERRQQRQSYLIPRDSLSHADYLPVTSDGSISSIANGAYPFVVGGYSNKEQSTSGSVWYSSAGPSRAPSVRMAPDISAPSDESMVRKGLLAPGNFGTAWVRMNGTSVAAPLAARAIAGNASFTTLQGTITALRTSVLSAAAHGPAVAPSKEGALRL